MADWHLSAYTHEYEENVPFGLTYANIYTQLDCKWGSQRAECVNETLTCCNTSFYSIKLSVTSVLSFVKPSTWNPFWQRSALLYGSTSNLTKLHWWLSFHWNCSSWLSLVLCTCVLLQNWTWARRGSDRFYSSIIGVLTYFRMRKKHLVDQCAVSKCSVKVMNDSLEEVITGRNIKVSCDFCTIYTSQ